MKPAARVTLEQPHLRPHRDSIERVSQRAAPRGLHRLMTWFLDEWSAEVPSSMHAGGVWRSRKPALDRNGEPVEKVPSEHIGGSLLGAPQLNSDFRALLESSPRQTNEDGYFVRPVHAALAKLCGRGGHWGRTADLQPAPFMARFLFRLACCGDLATASKSMGIPIQVQQVYAEQALYRLWKAYEVGPGSMAGVA